MILKRVISSESLNKLGCDNVRDVDIRPTLSLFFSINKVSDKYDKLSSILKPIKDSLKGGCDKVVEAIKAEVSKSDAYITSHAPELLLFTIALLAMIFH